MIFAKGFLPNVESAQIEISGLFILRLIAIEERQVVQAFGGVRMIIAQLLLANLERAPIERLRLSMLGLVVVQDGQKIDDRGDIGVVSAQEPFPALQCAFSQ